MGADPDPRTGPVPGADLDVRLALYFAAISPLRAQLRQADSRALRIYLPLVLGSVIWALTPYILLGGRVRSRRLLATGVLTAVSLTLFAVASRIYMPAVMSTDARRYGLIGAAFGIVSWLFASSVVLIGSATTGAVLAGADQDQPAAEAGAGGGRVIARWLVRRDAGMLGAGWGDGRRERPQGRLGMPWPRTIVASSASQTRSSAA